MFSRPLSTKNILLLFIAVIVLAAVVLLLMGRIPICECGYVKLWHGNPVSSENSQHIADPYTPSHIIHGFIFYFLLWKFARRLPVGSRFLIALIVEAAWEIFENTPFTINRYRAATISLDYYGDSVINSVFDILAQAIGFVMAWKLPVWSIVAIAVFFEVLLGYLIRDNLTLNIIMLIYPLEFIKAWQMGG
ncbi:MAG: DUF2585 domain-containing protein [Candidatus Colwellbacteria bacterium]|nr:DUF2585 domain-containing protein [Candidatus Colwellbacteria bacterium]MBI3273888.1 DUF2585 domain-containing protein [Candidatus Colwellbacteria bacterium]